MPMKYGYLISPDGTVTARRFHKSYGIKEIQVKLLKKRRKETSEDGIDLKPKDYQRA